jgi:hypothetical protein
MTRALAASLAFVLASTVALGATRAQDAALSPEDAEATRLKDEGNLEMDRYHQDRALVAYERALAIARDPDLRASLVYNRGRALQALSDYPAALDAFETFAATASDRVKSRVPGFEPLMEDTRKRVGTLTVRCAPADAELVLNDRVRGTCATLSTPFRVNAGTLRIQLRRETFVTRDATLSLPSLGSVTFDATLLARDATATLRVVSQAGASVAVDGRELGVVPVEATLPPGRHEVLVRRAGYRDHRTSVVLDPASRRTLNVDTFERTPLYQRGWFWGLVTAAVVVAGVTTAVSIYALQTERSPSRGNLEPGNISTGNLPFSPVHF